MKKCPKCGENCDDDWKICIHCLERLKERKIIKDDQAHAVYKKKYEDYISTCGFSKNMIRIYIGILLVTAGLGWLIMPFNLWITSLCFLLSLPLLFYCRYCQYTMNIFGRFNTPVIWHSKKIRWVLIFAGLLFLTTSILLFFSLTQSIPTVIFLIGVVFWLINSLVCHHMKVMSNAMEEEGRLREDE